MLVARRPRLDRTARGLRPLQDLTARLTARANDSHAAPDPPNGYGAHVEAAPSPLRGFPYTTRIASRGKVLRVLTH